jgi:hypothetical protein
MMTRTKEHASRSQIQTDDSHADHSLGVRSTSHRRDKHNRIEYGIRTIRTVLLRSGDPAAIYVVADDRNPESILGYAPQAIHRHHVSMLPGFYNTTTLYHRGGRFNLDAFLPGLQEADSRGLNSWVFDPYKAGGEGLPFNAIYWTSGVDTGWRSMSKFGAMHFRFDDLDCHSEWCAAFEQAASQHVSLTPTQMMRAYFEAALILGNERLATVSEIRKTKTGSSTFVW